MAIAPEFMWFNELMGSRLLAIENCSIFRDFYFDNKYIKSVFSRIGVDK